MLVVSPLLALMRDQLAHLPAGLPAAMLASDQPRSEARQVLSDLRVSSPPPLQQQRCQAVAISSTFDSVPTWAQLRSGAWLACDHQARILCNTLHMMRLVLIRCSKCMRPCAEQPSRTAQQEGKLRVLFFP